MLKRIKRIAAGAAAMIGLVSVCGCSAAKLPFIQQTPDFNKSYTISADIVYDDMKAKADLTRLSASNWEFTFTEPKQLNGITMSLSENGYSAQLGGLKFSAGDGGYTLLPKVIGGAIDLLSSCTSENIEAADGVLTMDTEYGGKKVTITANERTGDLISLKCPYHKLSVNFSGQKSFTPPDPEEGGLIITN